MCPDDSPVLDDDDEMFKATEEGILGYCFTLDDGLPVPEARFLEITWAAVTPAFFKEVVEVRRWVLPQRIRKGSLGQQEHATHVCRRPVPLPGVFRRPQLRRRRPAVT